MAESANNTKQMDNGTHIMVAGICWQMFTMTIFVILAVMYVVNVSKANIQLPEGLKSFCYGMAIVTLMIFIRCIYRTAELMEGWTGYIITHEVYFACFDFVPMIIAIVCLNVWHPGMYIGGSAESAEAGDKMKDVESGEAVKQAPPSFVAL